MTINSALKITAIITLAIISIAVSYHLLWIPFSEKIQYRQCVEDVSGEQARRMEVDIQAKERYVALESQGLLPRIQIPSYATSYADEYKRTSTLIQLRNEIGPDIDWAKPFGLETELSKCELRYMNG